MKAVLSRYARRLAESLRLAPRRRSWAGRVYQTRIRRACDAWMVVCVGLSDQAGTAHAANDRQHPDACNHCPLY